MSRNLPLLVLMGFAAPGDVDPEKLYRAQLWSTDRLGGVRLLMTLIALVFIWGVFYPAMGAAWLTGWTLMAAASAILPLFGSLRRMRKDYAGVTRSAIVRQGLGFLIQGLLWSAPMILFTRDAGSVEIISLWTLASCLMAGVAIAYASLPFATLCFLSSIGGASVWMMYAAGSPQLAALVNAYALTLLIASLKHAREFGSQLSTRTELAEKSEVVSLLLREYEEAGADWLWQTDAARRISGVSPRLAALLGLDAGALEGLSLVQILAGEAWESGDFATGLHALDDKLRRRESFSNIALPVMVQGRKCWWELSASPRFDERGMFLGFRGVGSDVTAQRESSEKIAQLARFDALTSLPNRLQLTEALTAALDRVERRNMRCAFLMIDLDRFKAVNDTLGHQVGDRLLALVSERLRRVCGEKELCGRIGGDEFAVVVQDVQDIFHVEQLALAIIDALSRPYEVGENTLYIGASVGSALAPRDGRTSEALIRSADLALYRAKDEGGGKHYAYEPKLHVHAEERRILELALREALEKGQLHVVYQPVVDAREGAVIGFESLVRWTHPEMGPISPGKFIPVAEDARLIAPIGEWVLRTACMEAMNWPDHVRVAVNVSAEQLGNPSFVTSVMSALAHSGLPASRLELEVTESVFMREGTGAIQILDQLLGLGIGLSLDDFGTGYSSLGYLSKTRFSTIKIDRSFVIGAAKNVAESLAIIRAVVAMADSLGMTTTAEGVETLEEAEMVGRLGCRKIQGFYFGRPMPAHEARALFANRASAIA